MTARLGILHALMVRLGRNPAAWVVLVGLSLAWLAWLEVGTYGITTARVRGDAPLYEIAFLAGLAGATAATASCEQSRWWLHALGPRDRLLSQGAALLGGAWAFQVVALAAPLALGLANDASALALGTIGTNAHLAALALILLALPSPAGSRAPALVLLTWPVATLVPRDTVLGQIACSLLGAAEHLHPVLGPGSATRDEVLVDIMAVGSLSLMAALLHTGPRARHEVRNPR